MLITMSQCKKAEFLLNKIWFLNYLGVKCDIFDVLGGSHLTITAEICVSCRAAGLSVLTSLTSELNNPDELITWVMNLHLQKKHWESQLRLLIIIRLSPHPNQPWRRTATTHKSHLFHHNLGSVLTSRDRQQHRATVCRHAKAKIIFLDQHLSFSRKKYINILKTK